MRYIDHSEVVERLSYDVCIPAVREAMLSLSRGEPKQIPRAIMKITDGRLLGVMAGALGDRAYFGSKIVSVFHENFVRGMPSHQGLVTLFDPETGAPICAADAGAITAIRTAAASAVATDVLAPAHASRLALLGYGEQAATHARAISKVRKIASITVWGRARERADAFAARMQSELGVPVTAAPSAESAVAEADIICTVTASAEPVLLGRWVREGVHVNVVGSSFPGPAEIDNDLVLKGRFIADCKENVLRAGAEFLRAKEAGVVGDDHVVAEIGEVLDGRVQGRRSASDITIYKSLGHIVQDLAAAAALCR